MRYIQYYISYRWRGELNGDEQLKDEPQHMLQGRITKQLLETVGISHVVLHTETISAIEQARKQLKRVLRKKTCSNTR